MFSEIALPQLLMSLTSQLTSTFLISFGQKRPMHCSFEGKRVSSSVSGAGFIMMLSDSS